MRNIQKFEFDNLVLPIDITKRTWLQPDHDINKLGIGCSKGVAANWIISGVPTTQIIIECLRNTYGYHFYLDIDQKLSIADFATTFDQPSTSGSNHVVITSEGADAITIAGIRIEGSEAFNIKQFSYPRDLSQGESLEFPLEFYPRTYGVYPGQLVINTSIIDHPAITIPLYGIYRAHSSYYRYINGLRYDRVLLDVAYYYAVRSPNRQIGINAIAQLIAHLRDANKITSTEKRTINYIWTEYDWTSDARLEFRRRFDWVIDST